MEVDPDCALPQRTLLAVHWSRPLDLHVLDRMTVVLHMNIIFSFASPVQQHGSIPVCLELFERKKSIVSHIRFFNVLLCFPMFVANILYSAM